MRIPRYLVTRVSSIISLLIGIVTIGLLHSEKESSLDFPTLRLSLLAGSQSETF